MERVFLTAKFQSEEVPERSEPACVPAYRTGKIQAATGEQSVVMVLHHREPTVYEYDNNHGS